MNTVSAAENLKTNNSDGFNIQHARMVRLFKTIHRLRWVTAEQVAILEYKSQLSAMNSARKWLKKNLDAGFLIERSISGLGRAFVLSKAAVDFMESEGVFDIRSGKDWGKFVNGAWMPTQTWRHEYIANLFASIMLSRGYEIITEYEIRRANPKIKKIPDLLVNYYSVKLKKIVWHSVEVEQYRKSSKHMQAMVASLYSVARGASKLKGLDGREITLVESMIVAMQGDTDERGHQLNHDTRIMSAVDNYRNGLYKHLSFDVIFYELCPKMGFTSDFFLISSRFEFNRGAKLIRWFEESGGELRLHDFDGDETSFCVADRLLGCMTEMVVTVSMGYWRIARRHYEYPCPENAYFNDEVLCEGKALTNAMAKEELVQRLKKQFSLHYEFSVPVGQDYQDFIPYMAVPYYPTNATQTD